MLMLIIINFPIGVIDSPISIHLMLMLIPVQQKVSANFSHYFNTSHVNVNRILNAEYLLNNLFQYISC